MAWSDPGPGRPAPAVAPVETPHHLLDDGFPPDPCDLLVIGCGNILRGDDAVGPVLIRHLFERGVPAGVRLVDGGTAGMDVAFGMRGASRVVIVDASATGAEPGTIYRVPAEELADLPPLDGLHTHNFRWDHALSFSAWLLGPHQPTDVTVFLIEAESTEPGAPLTPRVQRSMNQVLDLILAECAPPGGSGEAEQVEITEAGYLHLPAAVAAAYFPSDALVARLEGHRLVLMPLVSAGHGGLVLKQRNPAGDRSVLVNEVLGFVPTAGRFDVGWDHDRGALMVPLSPTAGQEGARGVRGADRGGPGARPVGGVPGGADRGRGGPAAGRDARRPTAGEDGRGGDHEGGRAPAATPGGTR